MKIVRQLTGARTRMFNAIPLSFGSAALPAISRVPNMSGTWGLLYPDLRR